MTIDPREYITNDKRLPTSLSGEAGKFLVVNAAEDGYELAASSGTASTGDIKMWPLDTPPSGWLMCDGAAIDPGYTALISLIGANTPNITFVKNSKGTDTNTTEAESVGTHGHGADAVLDHSHSVTVASVGNHTHGVPVYPDPTIPSGGGAIMQADATGTLATPSTNGAGAHNHSAVASSTGGHTPVIQDHSGTNQPACTLINFCIKT